MILTKQMIVYYDNIVIIVDDIYASVWPVFTLYIYTYLYIHLHIYVTFKHKAKFDCEMQFKKLLNVKIRVNLFSNQTNLGNIF